mmetsp:Transcript_5141/g.22948  ORF Transcript_5141/g.22948 Transcript_5141/m.22948 type:complete len:422 (-) Transcript_5141:634-1899(-)
MAFAALAQCSSADSNARICACATHLLASTSANIADFSSAPTARRFADALSADSSASLDSPRSSLFPASVTSLPASLMSLYVFLKSVLSGSARIATARYRTAASPSPRAMAHLAPYETASARTCPRRQSPRVTDAATAAFAARSHSRQFPNSKRARAAASFRRASGLRPATPSAASPVAAAETTVSQFSASTAARIEAYACAATSALVRSSKKARSSTLPPARINARNKSVETSEPSSSELSRSAFFAASPHASGVRESSPGSPVVVDDDSNSSEAFPTEHASVGRSSLEWSSRATEHASRASLDPMLAKCAAAALAASSRADSDTASPATMATRVVVVSSSPAGAFAFVSSADVSSDVSSRDWTPNAARKSASSSSTRRLASFLRSNTHAFLSCAAARCSRVLSAAFSARECLRWCALSSW